MNPTTQTLVLSWVGVHGFDLLPEAREAKIESRREVLTMKWRSLYLRVVYTLLAIASLVLASGAHQKWG